jgi:hypothetical protein
MAEPGTPEEMLLLTIAAEWNRGVVATWFHGSSLVTATLQQFDRQLSCLFDKARVCRLTWEEFADEHRATEESLEAFIEAVRQELKHPPLKVSVRIPRWPPPLSDGRAEPQATN